MLGSATSGSPIVAVIIPAWNAAGRIGRILDRLPDDGRFEAIVVDDGSTDRTGDLAREHGAALVVRHGVRSGVGAAIRDGLAAGLARKRPYVALLSGDEPGDPADLIAGLEALQAAEADYLQGSRWLPGGDDADRAGKPGLATRLYSLAFSGLAGRRVTDATNGFRIFRSSMLHDQRINLYQSWLTGYDLEPYVLYKAIRCGYRVIEYPVTAVHRAASGRPTVRGMRDGWRLFRPALLLRTGVKR